MHFRFVGREDSANLILRFGPYAQAVPQGVYGWAQAFLPEEWIGKARAGCGKRREGHWPDGSPCREGSQNIITFNHLCWTASGGDFASNLRHHEYLAWVFDRRLPHFRARPDGPCITGSGPGTVWSDACVPFAQSPHHLEIQGVDLASVIAHELGHTLVGGHTPEEPGAPYLDWGRPQILDASRCVRLNPDGFSVLFPGGEDKWWNRRCAFPADMARLRGMGYRVAYPQVAWTLTLRRRDGSVFRTRDWSLAQAAMLWTRQAKPLTRAQERKAYFLVDLERAGPYRREKSAIRAR